MDWFRDVLADKELFIAFCAMSATLFASLMALIGVVVTSFHNKLSVMPMITYAAGLPDNGSDDGYEIALVNEGVGPVLFEDIYMYLNKKEYDVSAEEGVSGFVDDLCQPVLKANMNAHHTWVGRGTVLGVGKTIVLVSIKGDGVDEIYEHNDGLVGIKLFYRDIYNRKWMKLMGREEKQYRAKNYSIKYLCAKYGKGKRPTGI